ncbi:L,D-peptidoglycan transpeptidase YkuD (ErfK/YbiS/YcfS/YnhG family) [Streptomyces sp. V1I1]|nr:L,D-peptidoglycan transpeptidase YkuD (ErfK/YbiS/YcfS/YnhG family) [Streptomyces sp. V1I1]
MLPSSRRFSAALAATGALFLVSACGGQGETAPAADVAASAESVAPDVSTSSASPSSSPSATASPSASASASPSGSASPSSSGSRAAAAGGAEKGQSSAAPAAPNFPVPVNVGNATQVITVKASGSYATVTAWAKGSSGWKSVISDSGRVGSNGVVDGSTRRQSTYTTPSGTYTITEGFGVESSGTSMPYTRVNSSHWWVQDPESKFYNQMHTEAGADFPLTESGERGSEHLINYPTQYAKALVINFNRWPATPGRGAGIFLHVNGKGATAGCVSVPRATMDRIMGWIKPGAHPRIAIG